MSKQLFPKRFKQNLCSDSHRRSPEQEAEVARMLGGRVTPGSGNGDIKGDVRVQGIMRVECKTTKNKSFSVTREMVRKIENAAVGSGEVPAMIIELEGTDKEMATSVAVVPLWVLKSLVNK